MENYNGDDYSEWMRPRVMRAAYGVKKGFLRRPLLDWDPQGEEKEMLKQSMAATKGCLARGSMHIAETDWKPVY